MSKEKITGKDRIEAAVRGEKLDRTPIYFAGDFAFYRYAKHDSTPGDYVKNYKEALDCSIEAVKNLKHVDAVSLLGIRPNKAAGAVWLSKAKLPGIDLPATESWQIEEIAMMKKEDYDIILDKGWKYYQKYYFENYIGITEKDILESVEYMEYTDKKLSEFGCVNMTHMMGPIIYDGLCAGRGIVNFTRDLHRMPDKVKATLDVITEEMVVDFKKDIRALKERCAGESFRVGIAPAVRGNCDFLSREKFDYFVWPLFQVLTNAVLEVGGTPFFHMDSNWNDVLDYFTEFPAQRCIFDSDGMTDLYKIKDVLGDRMCITGNLSASLMALGTPDEVYHEAKKLIRDFGPNGFVMSGACTLPHNINPDNIDAVISACIE